MTSAKGPGCAACSISCPNAVPSFSQRDLYVFCFGPDGKLDAHPNWWPEPSVSGDGAYGEPTLWGGLENWSHDPVRKTSYVTRIDDHVCGVGYYH